MNTLSFVGTITRSAVIKPVLSGRVAEYYVRCRCGSGRDANVHLICFQAMKSDGAVVWALKNLVEGQEVTVIGGLSPREFERGGPIGVTVVYARAHGWEIEGGAGGEAGETA